MPRILTVLALSALPAWASALELDEARHLLNRTGLGASPEEIETLLPLTREEAVQKLLDASRREPLTEPPDLPEGAPEKPSNEERREMAMALKGWWVREMLETDSPLTERMVLFWHNHFTSGLEKVKWAPLLWKQNILFRTHALGSFKTLLHAVARDPAMVLYLDSQSNRKDKPNENFARELLELFTLGEGHYAEEDIREAARAFTGWQLDRKTGKFRIAERQHDDGRKTFLGKSGAFGGDEILDILLEQDRTSEWVVTKLWHEFVSDAPDEAEVKRLAEIFRSGNHEMKPLLKALFTSSVFWDPANRGALIKSPVDLIVGTVRTLELPAPDPIPLAQGSRLLGQDLFDPPNVKGWPGGTAWITTSTLLNRRQILERALRGKEMGMGERAPGFVETQGLERAQRILLPLPPTEPLPEYLAPGEALSRLLLDPGYQLR